MRLHADRPGFSLVEVIIAMMLLSVAVLAMGASTGYIMNQVRAAELRTERAVTVRQAAEQLRSAPWDDLATKCEGLDLVSNGYTVECAYMMHPTNSNLAQLEIVSTGPGYSDGRIMPGVAETLLITRASPVQ